HRQCPHSHRHGLRPGIAAHRGDDGHQHRQCNHLLYGRIEQPDHEGHHHRRDEVDHQPRHTAAHRVDGGVGHVLVAHAGQQLDVLVRFLVDHVDDVVDGQHADQPPAFIDHAYFHQVIAFE